MDFRLSGLVAATFTPMRPDYEIDLDNVPALADHLIEKGIKGFYVCGSTGEGPLLTTEERKATARAYIEAAAGRVPVVVQVGHTSPKEAQGLAAHAQEVGADAISALPPTYFLPDSTETLIDCLAEVTSAAPDLPFYYYHIPRLSNADFNMLEFLTKAAAKLPTLAGIKFSSPLLHQFQECARFEGGRFSMLFGVDEMNLCARAVGAEGMVGSTYNLLAPQYYRIAEAFEGGRREEAEALQAATVKVVRAIVRYRTVAGLKASMKFVGLDCGPSRLPLRTPDAQEMTELESALKESGFFEMIATD